MKINNLSNLISVTSPLILLSIFLIGCNGNDSNSNQLTSNSLFSTSSKESNKNNEGNDLAKTKKCDNGIPNNLNTEGNGFLDEDLYQLTNYIDNNINYLMFKKMTLKNGVWYQNNTQLIKNSLGELRQKDLEIIGYQLSPNFITTTFNQTSSINGLPQAYIKAQSSNSIKYYMFNDTCNLESEREINITLQQVDISGKTFNELLGNFKSDLDKELPYISTINKQILSSKSQVFNKLKSNSTKFPAGSKIAYQFTEQYNSPTLYFNENSQSSFSSLNDYIYAPQNTLPAKYQWKRDKFANFNVAYPVLSATQKPDNQIDTYVYPAVEFNGKIYQAVATYPGNFLDIESLQYNHKSFFNQKAAETFAQIYSQSLQ